jgi:hypothetical protein
VRTLLYEAANVMLTRYKGQLKLKDWAFAIARRSSMREARVALAPASQSSCTRCSETERSSRSIEALADPKTGGRIQLQEERRPREGVDDGADCVAAAPKADCDFNQAALHPAYPIKCRTSTQRTQAPESVDTPKSLPPLTN